MPRRGVLFVVFVLASVATTASAQDPWRIAIGAAAIYSTQESQSLVNQATPGVPRPGVGGSAGGVVITGEIALTPVVGVGVEFTETDRFATIQTTSGVYVSKSEHRYRDVLVSPVLFYFHPPLGERVRVGVVGGVSFVQEDDLVRTATAPPGSGGPFGPYGAEQSITRSTFAGTGGLDIAVLVSRHVSVGPTFRAHFISRAALGESFSSTSGLSLAAAVLRVGGGIKVSF
jgi:hypothetical protein